MFLFLMFFLLSCKNNSQNNGIQANTGIKMDSFQLSDSCTPLAVKPNYNDEEEKFRTIEFKEGQETFRRVSDTTGGDFYVHVQRKISDSCWHTTNTFECRQVGLELGKDFNDDGFPDIYNSLKIWTEIALYDPKNKNFSSVFECGSSNIRQLPEKVKFDMKSIGQWNGVESRLFRFDNLQMNIFADIKVLDERSKEDENEFVTVAIELYSVKGEKETLIQQWKPTEFKTFMKNNGREDYFQTEEFITDFWKNNWQKYVPK